MFNTKFNMLLLLMATAMAMERPPFEEKFSEEKRRADGQRPFILVVGETGAGKSRTLSNLAGHRLFAYSPGMDSCTQEPQLARIQVFGDECEVDVLDTCGLNDSNGKSKEQVQQLIEVIEMISRRRATELGVPPPNENMSVEELKELQKRTRNCGGIHQIVIVTSDAKDSVGRVSKATKEMFAQLAGIFGPGWEKNAVIIATHWKDPALYETAKIAYHKLLEQENTNAQEQMEFTPEGRYVMKNGPFELSKVKEYIKWRVHDQIRRGIAMENIAGWTNEFKIRFSKEPTFRAEDDIHTAIAADKFVEMDKFATSPVYKNVKQYQTGFKPTPQVHNDIPVFLIDNQYNDDDVLNGTNGAENARRQRVQLRDAIETAFTNKPMKSENMKAVLSQRDREIENAIRLKSELEKAEDACEAAVEQKEQAEHEADQERTERLSAEEKATAAKEQAEEADARRQAAQDQHETDLNQADAKLKKEKKQRKKDVRKMQEQMAYQRQQQQLQQMQQQQNRGILESLVDRVLGGFLDRLVGPVINYQPGPFGPNGYQHGPFGPCQAGPSSNGYQPGPFGHGSHQPRHNEWTSPDSSDEE